MRTICPSDLDIWPDKAACIHGTPHSTATVWRLVKPKCPELAMAPDDLAYGSGKLTSPH